MQGRMFPHVLPTCHLSAISFLSASLAPPCTPNTPGSAIERGTVGRKGWGLPVSSLLHLCSPENLSMLQLTTEISNSFTTA